MSANLDLVRSIYDDWERGVYRTLEWADPNLEYVWVGGPTPGTWIGVTEAATSFGNFLSAWEEWRVHVDKIRELDGDRVFVLVHASARGRESGIELPPESTSFAQIFQVRDGKVTSLVSYFDRATAFADLGLAPDGDTP
ncbi:MAG TPA: nuclear transport factor 2 family protein [Solirubrobacteraceae bacterium]|nr:nuclear transport factor 2 family protein [Solirubrobacteraceae bacterium]